MTIFDRDFWMGSRERGQEVRSRQQGGSRNQIQVLTRQRAAGDGGRSR
jgi:hypothetical protein